MIRCIQIGKEMLLLLSSEKNGKVTVGDMRVVPLVTYYKIEKGFKHEEIHQS